MVHSEPHRKRHNSYRCRNTMMWISWVIVVDMKMYKCRQQRVENKMCVFLPQSTIRRYPLSPSLSLTRTLSPSPCVAILYVIREYLCDNKINDFGHLIVCGFLGLIRMPRRMVFFFLLLSTLGVCDWRVCVFDTHIDFSRFSCAHATDCVYEKTKQNEMKREKKSFKWCSSGL